MKYNILSTKFIDNNPRISCLIAGLFSGLIFAPIFFLPGILAIGVIAHHSFKAKNIWSAFKLGSYFGYGHFFVGLYWVCLALFCYIDQFWWAIPLAIFGIPAALSIFVGATSASSYLFKNFKLFNVFFVIFWLLFEWFRSWVLTGFPWNLVAYSLSSSDLLIQSASVFGVFGLTVIVVYIGIGARYFIENDILGFKRHVIASFLIILAMLIFGFARLRNNPTAFTDVTVRIVQASIPLNEKWGVSGFSDVLQKHLELSSKKSETHPQIVVWPEASISEPINAPYVLESVSSFLSPDQILLAGAVSQDRVNGRDYVGMYGLKSGGKLDLEYRKIHLVPFGEYIPLGKYLPIKKLTDGMLDYSPGDVDQEFTVQSLKITPIVCYEVIFPDEVRQRAQDTDLIINIAYDTWFGKSSGPYQHYHIARMRAVENGVPLIRSANNGISAIIDPVGRVLQKTDLDSYTILDGYIPSKLINKTIYGLYSQYLMMAFLILIIFLIDSFKLK
jgi:apolipoprotein N-acyltransferase